MFRYLPPTLIYLPSLVSLPPPTHICLPSLVSLYVTQTPIFSSLSLSLFLSLSLSLSPPLPLSPLIHTYDLT